MPELPEVETIRRVLEPQIIKQTILRVEARHPQVIAGIPPETFCAGVRKRRITGTGRRGKFLTLLLDNGGRIVLHLRMTGCLLVEPAGCEPEKYTHLIFHLENGTELRFSDMRRFGRFWLIRAGEEDTVSGIHKLGYEPFDARLTPDYLQKMLGGRKKTVKQCLLDQSIIAGIGNIYSDEILFRAHIHPARKACSLTDAELACLAALIPQTLSYYIEKNAISPEDYLASKGQDYRNTPYLSVYGHSGEPCPACGAVLKRVVIGGRSSVCCPQCQKE